VTGAAHVAHGALRGAVAAMAMTGMRAFTVTLGLVEEEPPRSIVRQRARRLVGRAPRGRRRAVREGAHWTYGAAGGAVFAALPESVRMRDWAGPAYGVVLWLAFEAVMAPALHLKQAQGVRPVERVALLADHLLYGFVLSETRRHPQE
jgi:hypothetical protein